MRNDFIASLKVVSTVERLTPETATRAGSGAGARVDSPDNAVQRNRSTFTIEALRLIIDSAQGRLFILRMRDRLTDHGLVGVAVVMAGEILNFVLSCRVIGLNGERVLLAAIINDARMDARDLIGRIVQTSRNLPVRNLYADNGFTDHRQGRWEINLAPPETPHGVGQVEGAPNKGRLVRCELPEPNPDAADLL